MKDNDFPGMMEKIQEQAFSLWNDFLVPDFGFKENFAQLTFSDTEVSIFTTEIGLNPFKFRC